MRTPEDYTPVRTSVVVAWFLALAVAVFGGLFVGNSFGSYKIGPNVGPYPPYEYSEPAVFAQGASTAPTVADPVPTSSATECVEYQKNGDCVQAPVVVGTPASEASKTRDGHMSGVRPAVRTPRVVQTPAAPASPTVTPDAPAAPSASVVPPATVVETPVVTPEVPAAPVETPECQEGEILDPEVGCVATQLPEEKIGQQVDGPNGEICVIVDVQGNMECAMPEDSVEEPLPADE